MLKINFLTSYYFQSRIINCPYDRNKLIGFKNKIEKKFNKHSKYIFKKINQLTGINWKDKKIDVWVIKGWHPSISSPLILNYYQYDVNFCFFNLIHELIHNNLGDMKFMDKKGKFSLIELEAIVNLVAVTVLKKVYPEKTVFNLSKRAEFMGMYKYVWKRVDELKKEIDFSQTTIKAYGTHNES